MQKEVMKVQKEASGNLDMNEELRENSGIRGEAL